MTAGHFDVRLVGCGDLAWLNVCEFEGVVEAVFSPSRTCVGVVLATALSLAIAERARGDFVDNQIRMLDPGVSDPEAFVERTKLAEEGTDLDAQCELFMRQFARLEGWPQDVTLGAV
jgi:hypothetical protein